MNVKHRKSVNAILYAAGTAVIGMTVIGFGIYVLSWNNTPVRKIAQVVPYPVAIIEGGVWVTYASFQKEVDAIRRYHELQSVNANFKNYELSSPEGRRYFEIAKKNLLERMIEDKIVERMAERMNITISQEEVEKEKVRLADFNGGEEKVLEKLAKAYKMNAAGFDDIIRKELLRKKVSASTTEEFGGGENAWVEELGKTSVHILLKDYYWDSSARRLEFSNSAMRDYDN